MLKIKMMIKESILSELDANVYNANIINTISA